MLVVGPAAGCGQEDALAIRAGDLIASDSAHRRPEPGAMGDELVEGGDARRLPTLTPKHAGGIVGWLEGALVEVGVLALREVTVGLQVVLGLGAGLSPAVVIARLFG